MRKSIPDLRVDHPEFTLDHCTILLNQLGKLLNDIYGADADDFVSIADQADPVLMRDDLLDLFSEKQLCRLFKTQFGKGVILGAFYSRYVVSQKED